jgi:hypothetical protein
MRYFRPMASLAAIKDDGSIRLGLGDRRWIRVGALVAVAVIAGAGLWLLRWSGGQSTATPDTFWYARDAFRYAGYSEHGADTSAARITCGAMSRARLDRKNYDSCLRYRAGLPSYAPARFERIFTSRPGYALLTAPFVRLLGGAGFLVGTAVLGVACGVAIMLLALAAGLRPARALSAEVAFYLLPTGLWASRMLAEPPMMLFLLTAMIGTVLLARGRRWIGGAGLLAVSLTCLCVVKPANGVALAAALAAVAVVLLPFARSRRAWLLIAGVSAAVLIGNFWLSDALHLPGLNETLQDTFTRHFRAPDVNDPWNHLSQQTGKLWRENIWPRMLDDPLIPVAFLVGAIGLFARIDRDTALPLLFAGLTGAAVASMHPLGSEVARLTVVTWIPVALGLAALAPLPGRPRPASPAAPARQGDGAVLSHAAPDS